MKKRVGLITFHFAHNYGTVMQAYGLIECLRTLGISANTIDYHPAYVVDGGKFKFPLNIKDIRVNLIIAYQKYTKMMKNIKPDYGLSTKFDNFQKEYLYIDRVKYDSITALRENPPVFDVYISGSDQIWYPSEQYGVDAAYFLDFGASSIKRVSYASSFGRDFIPEDSHQEIGRLLKNINVISVREKSGVDIVNRLSNSTAYWMPDPTILLSSYEKIIVAPSEDRPYMMSYILRSGKRIFDIQKFLADRLELKIVAPYNAMRRWKNIGEIVYPGPKEWLGYIKYSKFVVTNSFHGTVFSVLFNKPFITIALSGNKSGLNERAKSFLSSVGLEHRLVSDLSENAVERFIDEEIDWFPVNEKLAKMRESGISFIKTQIMN